MIHQVDCIKNDTSKEQKKCPTELNQKLLFNLRGYLVKMGEEGLDAFCIFLSS